MEELSVRYLAIDSLKPYENNARTHSAEQIAQICDSIQEYGFTNPVLIDEDKGIIAGHGRVEAARRLDMDRVPTITLSGLTEAQRRAYVIADNKLAMNAGWHPALLVKELTALKEVDFDLELTGFSDDEIQRLLRTGEQEGEDDIPEAPEAVTKPGDLWILGKHRLLCGDATSADDVGRLLGDVQPHLMVTDPPYGVAYDAQWRERAGLQDAGAYGKVTNDQNADWREAWALFPGDVAYVWCAPGPLNATVLHSLEAAGFDGRMQIVWAKSRLVIGRGHYHCRHENCWYAVRNGRNAHWTGSRKESTVWEIDKPMKSETGHSTQKPVECMRRPILNNSNVGQVVYDPFLGSGTTIIAAETEQRACYGLELEPAYCDIIVNRWEQFTGEKACLSDDPRSK